MGPPGPAWPDERIDDMAKRLDLLGTAAMVTARHDVRLDNHDQMLAGMHDTLVRIEGKLDDQIADRRWSPKVLATMIGTVSAAMITSVTLVLTSGPHA